MKWENINGIYEEVDNRRIKKEYNTFFLGHKNSHNIYLEAEMHKYTNEEKKHTTKYDC